MNVDVVVDIGNTRIKWGRCSNNAVAVVVSLPPDDPAAWERQYREWGLTGSLSWALAGVNPIPQDLLVEWLEHRRQRVLVLQSHAQLPLQVQVEHPDRVGIDRLLNAVAINSRRKPGDVAFIIDAGSAITVDCVDDNGVFQGGAILPGLRLMAQALHDYTALLPLIDIQQAEGDFLLPAKSTRQALEAGIYCAVKGGIEASLKRMSEPHWKSCTIFFGGGDGPFLAPQMEYRSTLWPEMTLEGIRLSAEALS